MKWNRLIWLIFLMAFTSIDGLTQSQLNIEITNLRNNDGVVILELFDANEKVIKKITKPITSKKCTIQIENLENAHYAIRFLHDENSNGDLDKNWIGMPKEGYGFSNDAFGFFGPKDFSEWLFELKSDTTLVFKTNY